MTILSGVYTSLTALLSFSKALDVLSDNVANLNTIGFKQRGYRFESLAVRESANQSAKSLAFRYSGAGTTVFDTLRNLSQGEIQQTSKITDLAVDGNGFFVLRSSSGQVYTRDGQFEIGGDGRLVHPGGGILQAFGESGNLGDLIIPITRTSPFQISSRIEFAGQLGTNATGNDTPYEVGDITVVDGDGVNQIYTASFENVSSSTSQGTWNVSVTDANGFTVGSGEIRFQSSGAPQPGFNQFTIQVRSSSGRVTPVVLYFGDPGSLDGAVQGGTSNLQVSSADGYLAGRASSFSFNEAGRVTVAYSNGQSEEAGQVAVASVPVPDSVQTSDGVIFRSSNGDVIPIGKLGTPGFGSMLSGSLELGNVDLSREFADIIILQRGFQASSQILNVSSQLIEDIYNNLGRS